ncbi:MAG TPA: heat-inducible transcriptional repressor HrcA [Alphaproteobacteria bacterium]|jgi:heat-inducible transcriptional repressor|nr:heat-inducible transcriptional repressor HrcA [Alphaproteobacteria bacterium]
MNERSLNIFKLIVEEYLKKGTPVSSEALKMAGIDLSPASIRNVMAKLEDNEYLYSPHVSAGRQPTEKGLRFFVDRLMTIQTLAPAEITSIQSQISRAEQNTTPLYERASTILSGLSSCIGLVIAPKKDRPIRQIQFIDLEPRRVLAIIIMQDDTIENRVVTMGQPVSKEDLEKLANYLNEHLSGKTISEFQSTLKKSERDDERRLQELSIFLFEKGIIPSMVFDTEGHTFIQGKSHLFEDLQAQKKMDEIRELLTFLEEKRNLIEIMSALETSQGVQIFIGNENPILQQPTWSTIIKAYHDPNGRIIGATGIIGPTRLNYGQIVPIVDYTSFLMEKMINTPYQDHDIELNQN